MSATARRYLLVTTAETSREDADGNLVVVPAGSVVNEVLWDGTSNWSPPPGTRAVPAE